MGKVSLVEEKVVQWELQVRGRGQVDYLQVYQMRIIFNIMRTTITTTPENVHMQISSVMFVRKKDIYIKTVLEKICWNDNMVKVFCH